MFTPKLLRARILSLLGEFGPMIVFYAANHGYGLKPAIALSTLFTLGSIVWKRYRREPLSQLFKYSAALTLGFGAVDLYAQQSLLFKYEASISNIFTALFFGATLFGDKSVLQEFYEKKPGAKPITPEDGVYFRVITSVWVGYFVLKAVAYAWMATRYSIEEGLVIRGVAGSGSFYAMLFLSIYGSRILFPYLKKSGVLSSRARITDPGQGVQCGE